MKQEKRKNAKIHWFRILDLILIPIYIIFVCLLFPLINKFSSKYAIMFIVITVLMLLIYLLSLKLKSKAVSVIRKIFMIALSVALIAGYIYVEPIVSSFNRAFVDNNDEKKQADTYITYDVYVLKNHPNDIQTLKDLENMKIGFVNKGKEENAYIASTLNKDITNYDQYGNYSELDDVLYDYENLNLDAIILSDKDKAKLTNLGSPLLQESKLLTSFKHKVETVKLNNKDIDVTKDIFTVFVSGTDKTGSPGEEGSLSDVNMLLIINPSERKITTVSIPRDSYVPNPAFNNEYDKLTHTGWDGVLNSVKAVEQMFQIDIDFYMKISFTSLIQVVDIIGGIDVDVAIDFCEQDENRNFNNKVCLSPGLQHLNGVQALAYARHRDNYPVPDLGRNQAQLAIIKGIVAQLPTAEGISKVDNILDILPDYFISNFSNKQVTSFISKQIEDLKPWTVDSIAVTGASPGVNQYTASGGYADVLYVSKTSLEQVHFAYISQEKHTKFSEFTFDVSSLYDTKEIDDFFDPEYLVR